MTLNWGHKLTIAIISFMGFILFLVISSHSVASDLEAEDYYEQEIEYQNVIDADKNTKGLKSKFQVSVDEKNLVIIIPRELQHSEIKGSLLILRPNDATLDVNLKIEGKNKVVLVNREQLSSGHYKVKLNLVSEGKTYFFEQQIIVD